MNQVGWVKLAQGIVGSSQADPRCSNRLRLCGRKTSERSRSRNTSCCASMVVLSPYLVCRWILSWLYSTVLGLGVVIGVKFDVIDRQVTGPEPRGGWTFVESQFDARLTIFGMDRETRCLSNAIGSPC